MPFYLLLLLSDLLSASGFLNNAAHDFSVSRPGTTNTPPFCSGSGAGFSSSYLDAVLARRRKLFQNARLLGPRTASIPLTDRSQNVLARRHAHPPHPRPPLPPAAGSISSEATTYDSGTNLARQCGSQLDCRAALGLSPAHTRARIETLPNQAWESHCESPAHNAGADPAADITQAVSLLDQVEPEAYLADKGYNSDALVAKLNERALRPSSLRKPIAASRAGPISHCIASAISSNASSAISSNTAPSPTATTSSPTHFLPPLCWFAYCSGSIDDRP